MANGLEIRSPFLDVDLASFCISLPQTLKIKNGHDKVLLRRAFKNDWPKSIQTRKKMGFGAPVREWLKQKDLISLKNEYLLDKNKKIHSYLDYNKTSQYFQKSNYQEWTLLIFSLWLEHNSSNTTQVQ